MQINIPYKSLGTGTGMNGKGGKLTSSLFLSGLPPTEGLEAVSKEYVDSKLTSIDASAIISDVLPVGRIPAFTGDVTSVPGSGVIDLNNTPVTPGTYTKVTVNSTGRITGASSLTSDDIPNLSWNKVNKSRPLTLSGYGITDALNKAGGTLSGFVSSLEAPVQTRHAVTKTYTDTKRQQVVRINAGDVIKTTVTSPPSGFLRCNGGQVSKTTYPALYAAIGDFYSPENINKIRGGKPCSLQYTINTSQTDDITDWSYTNSTVIPTALSNSNALVTKNFVYLLGGTTSSGATNKMYRANIDANGKIETWLDCETIYPTDNYGNDGLAVSLDLKGIDNDIIPEGSINATVTGRGEHGSTNPTFTYTSVGGLTESEQVILATDGKIYQTNFSSSTPNVTLTSGYKYRSINVFIDGHYAVLTEEGIFYKSSSSLETPVATLPFGSKYVALAGLTSAKQIILTEDGKIYHTDTGYSTPDYQLPSANNYVDVTAFIDGNYAVLTEDGKVYKSSEGMTTPSYTLPSGNKYVSISGLTDEAQVILTEDGKVFNTDFSLTTPNVTLTTSLKYKDITVFTSGHYAITTTLGKVLRSHENLDVATFTLPEPTQYVVVKGEDAVITVNGVTYTFVGGNGVDAVSRTETVTLPDVGLINYNYNVPSKAVLQLNYVDVRTIVTYARHLPVNLTRASVVSAANKVHSIGGFTTTSSASVYTSEINTDGSLSRWKAAPSLPSPVSDTQLVLTRNKLYVIGGVNGATALNTVYVGDVHSDGNIIDWTTGSNLGFTIHSAQVAVIKDKVYLLGGVINGLVSNKVYMATIQISGHLSEFTEVVSLPINSSKAVCYVTGNKVYLIGGTNQTGVIGDVCIGTMALDGTISSWTIGTSVEPITESTLVATYTNLNLITGKNSLNQLNNLTQTASILGGLNDYSTYYGTMIIPTTGPTFYLPDLSAFEATGLYYYIKS